MYGFIVHAWPAGDTLRLAGRLANGQSFALVDGIVPARIFVAGADALKASEILGLKQSPGLEPAWQSFAGDELVALELPAKEWTQAARRLAAAGVPAMGDPPRSQDDWLTRKDSTGGLELEGDAQAGRLVDQVFDPRQVRAGQGHAELHWLALDIETAPSGEILAVSLVSRWMGSSCALQSGDIGSAWAVDEVLFRGPPREQAWIRAFASEAGLLSALLARIRQIDPDIITGWNVIDFDFMMIDRRCAALGIPFLAGRTDESVRYEQKPGGRARVFLPGRQVLDAMRLLRGSGTRFEDQTLDTVAAHILGTGKTVQLRGEAKLAELARLYQDEPDAFCGYCREDSRLVLRILETTGLDSLTQHRAQLTGVGLDLAWTSIPTFERIYGLALSRRRILPPPGLDRPVSGASGGMVLDPLAGLFRMVLVFDFRSLYPSLMRTFAIDPLGHERAEANPESDDIIAPNGARFRRDTNILPDLIAEYFSERQKAQAAGDETAAFVYKILMNSFYGVLGSGGCRYGRTELAGAITTFGRFWLEYSRDFFKDKGYRVLYGDTDSVFVETGTDDAIEAARMGQSLAAELNEQIARDIHSRYQVESCLAIRSEKVYGRFLIPRMRLSQQAIPGEVQTERGRAKGYAGLLMAEDGASSVEVKGMEAVRSDWTPLARRFQTELLAMVFADRPKPDLLGWAIALVAAVRSGQMDGELVYRKSLRRPAQEYGHAETPPIRAARLLGWTDRRGTVEYLITTAGAEPLGQVEHPVDYQHYLDHQLKPIWQGILDAAGLVMSDPFSTQLDLPF